MPRMRNIELKARLGDVAKAARVCEEIGAVYRGDIRQTDTYFHVPSGRLKLRQNDPGDTELIFYHRADLPGSKASDYEIAPASRELGDVLARALGVRCRRTKGPQSLVVAQRQNPPRYRGATRHVHRV